MFWAHPFSKWKIFRGDFFRSDRSSKLLLFFRAYGEWSNFLDIHAKRGASYCAFTFFSIRQNTVTIRILVPTARRTFFSFNLTYFFLIYSLVITRRFWAFFSLFSQQNRASYCSQAPSLCSASVQAKFPNSIFTFSAVFILSKPTFRAWAPTLDAQRVFILKEPPSLVMDLKYWFF